MARASLSSVSGRCGSRKRPARAPSRRRSATAIATSTPRRSTATSARSARRSAPPACKREEIFLTTKVRQDNLEADKFARSVENSLKLLDVPNVDLLLIHWPNAQVPMEESIGALNKAKREGLDEAHRGRELHRRAARCRHEGDEGAAGHQPDRGASVSRPDQGDRGDTRPRHEHHRLLPARARQGAGRAGAGAHRQGPWQDRLAGRAALAGAAGHRRSFRARGRRRGSRRTSLCSISRSRPPR